MLPSYFIGAIGAGFSVWIGARWGLASEGRFTPASMSWLKRRRPFELKPWPNQREAPPANYAFFSTLSLVVTLRPMISLFRAEAALAPRREKSFSPSGAERVTLLTAPTRRDIWRSFQLLCEGLQEAGRRRGRASLAPALAGGANLPVVGKPL